MTIIRPKHAPSARALHEQWLEALLEDGVNLTAWETDFLDSLLEWMGKGRDLTEKQAAVLEDIYTKRVP